MVSLGIINTEAGSKLRYYLKLCRRHKHYEGWRQGLRFAWSHKAFWNGCVGDDTSYTHIGKGGS